MSSRRPLLLAVGLLLGGLVGSGCAPSTSGPPSATDSTTASSSHAAKTSSKPSPSSPPSTQRPPPRPSSDPSRTVAQHLADASTKARIKQALVRERSLRAFNFFPEVVRGNVTLRGDVDTREQYHRIERIVRRLEGVETITNQVTVEGRRVSTAKESSEDSSGTGAVYHTVHRGDTLWDIARTYDVSIQRIKALNARPLTSLQPGERIRVQ